MNTPTLPDKISWPAPPEKPQSAEADFAKILYQGVIDEVKTRWRDQVSAATEEQKLVAARLDGRVAAEDALRLAVQSAYLDVVRGALDRALTRANFVTAVAGAVGTSYAALLALVYSVSGNQLKPLPPTGIVPAVFLGLSFVLSAFYVAYIRPYTKPGHILPTGTGAYMQEDRLLFFIKWVNDGTMQRAWALRVSIVCLGIGVALMPLPFLERAGAITAIIIGMGILGLTVAVIYELISYLLERIRGGSQTSGV